MKKKSNICRECLNFNDQLFVLHPEWRKKLHKNLIEV